MPFFFYKQTFVSFRYFYIYLNNNSIHPLKIIKTMSKVKSTNSGLQAGTANSSKSVSGGDKSTHITATKNGNTRTFKRLTWDFLPPDKDGWVEVSGTPAEPKTTKLNPVKTDDDPKESQELLDARAEYKNVFGTTPIETLNVTELLEAINQKVEHDQSELLKGLTEKVLTQEDLDLNPDWAKAGKKAGETIFVNADGVLSEVTAKPVVETPAKKAEPKASKAAKEPKAKTTRKVVSKAKGGNQNGENA